MEEEKRKNDEPHRVVVAVKMSFKHLIGGNASSSSRSHGPVCTFQGNSKGYLLQNTLFRVGGAAMRQQAAKV